MPNFNRLKTLIRSRGFLLFCFVFVVYNLNFRIIGSGDTIASAYLPLSLINDFNFDLNEINFLYAGGLPYFLTDYGGRIYSNYSPITPLMAVPVYLVPTLLDSVNTTYDVMFLEKLSASLMASASVLMVYMSLKRLEAGEWTALILALSYALATSTWTISAQTLWDHTPGQLFIAVALFSIVSAKRAGRRYLLICGAASALAVAARMNNLIIVLAITAYVLIRFRKDFWPFFIFPVIIAAWLMIMNYSHFGTLLGGSGELLRQAAQRQNVAGGWAVSFREGFIGILFSPSRGLFIFSPWLIFAFAGMAALWFKKGHSLFKCLCVGVVITILFFSKYSIWWGGLSYGPRFFVDILPVLVVFPIFLKETILRRKALAVVAAVLVVFSISVQFIGAFNYSKNWYTTPTIVDLDHERLWDWQDTVITRSIKDGAQEPIFLGYLAKKLTGRYGANSSTGNTEENAK